jgi:hypothetical protein
MTNGTPESSGSFDIQFKTQKAFTAFGTEFSKCNFNFRAHGKLLPHRDLGNLTYEVGFKATCECNKVLSFFQVAYDKTFTNKEIILPSQAVDDFISETQTEIETKDYNATLKICSVKSKILQAREEMGRAISVRYQPKTINVGSSQEYSLTLKNESGRDWVFYVYQTMPDPTPTMLSLAWFASPYPIAVSDEIEFKWYIDYNFVWGSTGEIKPGITYKASGKKDADLQKSNSTEFGYNSSGAPTLSLPTLDEKSKGTLVINDLDKKYSVGIGMSGQGTFVEQAGPTLQHFFTPTPIYWVGAATKMSVGEVLDIKTLTKTEKVVFATRVYAVTKTLNASYQWEDS